MLKLSSDPKLWRVFIGTRPIGEFRDGRHSTTAAAADRRNTFSGPDRAARWTDAIRWLKEVSL